MRTVLALTYIMIGIGFEAGMRDHPHQSNKATAVRILMWPMGAGHLLAEAREFIKDRPPVFSPAAEREGEFAPINFPQESATPWEAGHTPAGKPAVFAADQSTVCTVHTDSDAHLIAVAVNRHRANIKPADTTKADIDWGY